MQYKLNRTGRRLLKQNNYILLYCIVDLIRVKNLEFNICKVKEHSGCQWNNAADLMAKYERESASMDATRIIDFRILCNVNVSLFFVPLWNNIELDRNIRKFCKMVSDTSKEVYWSYNKYWRNYFGDV